MKVPLRLSISDVLIRHGFVCHCQQSHHIAHWQPPSDPWAVLHEDKRLDPTGNLFLILGLSFMRTRDLIPPTEAKSLTPLESRQSVPGHLTCILCDVFMISSSMFIPRLVELYVKIFINVTPLTEKLVYHASDVPPKKLRII